MVDSTKSRQNTQYILLCFEILESSLKRLKQCPHFPGRIAEKKKHTLDRNLGIHDNKFLILIQVHALTRSHHKK